MKEGILVYPHQLFKDSGLIAPGRTVFLIEDPLFFTQYQFHKQKLMLHRASMRAYQDTLVALGHHVVYVESADISRTEDIGGILGKHGITHVLVYDVVDDWLWQRLAEALAHKKISFTLHDTPLFLTSKEDLDTYFLPKIRGGKSLLMHPFYVWHRRRLGILVDESLAPVGGSWSYDKDNRKKLPKTEVPPPAPPPSLSPYVVEARGYVESHFPSNYGSTETFFYPVTHAEARAWFAKFLTESLEKFGPYEDAMAMEHPFVYHSVLSPLLNNGLLDVRLVLDETMKFYRDHHTPLASVEGFVRQIIGWREYVRAIYIYHGRSMRSTNYFQADKKLPISFWSGTTGIEPVDHTIATTLQYAYSHHISRLMIMGNIMNLCGINPDSAYRWFMEMYIDAYDWVMVPNVYGMALYADGGTITTKPYISSSRYILSMSDFKKGPWSEIWDALFWNFIGQHFELLSTENRLGFMGITYNKMSLEKKEGYKKIATQFIASLETSSPD